MRRPRLLIAIVSCAAVLVVAAVIGFRRWNHGLPRTKDEAVREIVAELPDKDRQLLARTRRENLGMFHMGWGMGIRNGLGLWGRNRALMNDISGGKPMHPDDMSGVIMEAVWDELHKGERVPYLDSSDPAGYFRGIDAFLREEKATNETRLLVHIPVWVLKDRSPFLADDLTQSTPQLIDEARRIIAKREPLTYLALPYRSEVDRNGAIFSELEAFLDDASAVPVPHRVTASEHDNSPATAYVWEPTSVAEIALLALSDLYQKQFRSVSEYRSWRSAVEADPILRWRYRPEVSEEDLRALLADRVGFARILCRAQRWIRFDEGHYEPRLTEQGAQMLERLTGQKVSYDYQQRTLLAFRLLRYVLAEVPVTELLSAMQNDVASIPPDWGTVIGSREQLDNGFFIAAVIQALEASLTTHPDKGAVWNLLEHQRRDAKVCWLYKGYLCRRMFAVDFDRTDRLVRELFAPRPLPTDRTEVWERVQVLHVMIDDHFRDYRDLIKDIYFAAQDVYEKEAREYIWEINNRIIMEGSEKHELYEEILREHRYRKLD